MKIVLNGRFLCARQTGVQRVAANLTLGLDRLLAGGGATDAGWEVCAPRGRKRDLSLSALRLRDDSLLTGQAWEQFELPFATGSAGLVNLCNVGPLGSRSALTMIHDAQVYLAPSSYSAAFVRWYRLALPRLAAQSRLVLTVSEFSKRMLVRFGVAAADRIRVAPNGADHMLEVRAEPAILARLGLEGASYVFAFGNLQPHKNLDLLLKAFADPRLGDLRLVVSGELDAPAIARVFGLAPGANVQLAGRCSDGEIRALLEGAACLAFPSSTEGFGLPPLEAMILGCPAVVAPAGALPEVCGQAATYAPLEDVGAWVEAIAGVAGDDSGRAARREQAKAHAQAFTWRRSAERLRGLIEEVM
ncbi:glycosyltransferase family 1 protein [Phenylobacterium sp.]|uniref:glycosyltransferase family 4 protein n=1 Tax=Phenylobacterium sp. TaxID=1871053 RepID=UPI002F3E4665